MASDQTNFDIDQGSDFMLDVALLDADGLPIDITNASIIGHIRKTVSSSQIEAQFSVEPVDLTAGKFILKLPAAVTSGLRLNPSPTVHRVITQFAYDVEVHFADGIISRILSGVLSINPEATR